MLVSLETIARIKSDFPQKFGIPRQSGLVKTKAQIIFEPKYRKPEALRGLEEYSHLWLLWYFSEAKPSGSWSPTVRPPRLGGNQRRGVFATRSPFRPNPLGLSSVQLEGIEFGSEQGPILHIIGADLLDQTPIFDIKPYIPYTDSHPEAWSGFSVSQSQLLQVEIAPELLVRLSEEQQKNLLAILAGDPRPAYQNDPERLYFLEFAGLEISFRVQGQQLKVENLKVPDNL